MGTPFPRFRLGDKVRALPPYDHLGVMEVTEVKLSTLGLYYRVNAVQATGDCPTNLTAAEIAFVRVEEGDIIEVQEVRRD